MEWFTSIKAEIIADSINKFGDRLTTFKLTYPRIIHSELMTHRLFSRNAASSRAVPAKKMIENVKKNKFIPIAFQKAHKGMQGNEYLDGKELILARNLWINSANLALETAEEMLKIGVTKQIINRILEPYQYYQSLVTATDFENFFKLRCPNYTIDNLNTFRSKKDFLNHYGKDFETSQIEWLKRNKGFAEIHIMELSEKMWDAYRESTPKKIKEGEWHTPFGDKIDEHDLSKTLNEITRDNVEFQKVKISVARCARISYETLGDNPKIDYLADINLHDKLLKDNHMSPFEHVAKAMTDREYESFGKNNKEKGWCNNFKGFIQYRYLIEKGS